MIKTDLPTDFLIVEDELLIAESIHDILLAAGYEKIRLAESFEEAIKEIGIHKPDIVLTDIALGKEKTGIDLGQLLFSKYHIPFIYITSHSSTEIINKAKHTRPNAYIVKPFKNEDLIVAIELALFNTTINKEAFKEDSEILIKEGRAFVKLASADILWIEVDGNYTTVHLTNGKRRVVRLTILDFEKQLHSDTIIRIHKSFLINKLYVSEIKSGYIVINNHKLPIGRTYQSNILNQIIKA
jgi:DNA-binding LytR/AlgR family response regulator